jgi:hypothetical protein
VDRKIAKCVGEYVAPPSHWVIQKCKQHNGLQGYMSMQGIDWQVKVPRHSNPNKHVLGYHPFAINHIHQHIEILTTWTLAME